MPEQHHISVKKTAIYHTLGDLSRARTIWFVLHGYGMLSEYFIKKFEPIVDEFTCVIAPEGLSKLYTKGFYGRVGASWMTKHDRETEISDYIAYLNQLYQHILSLNSAPSPKVNLLGFSQGGATVSRWAVNGAVKMDNLILWSSAFPEDIKFEKVEGVNTFVLYGDQDEFGSDKTIKNQQLLLENSTISYQLIPFIGNHDIPSDVLVEQTKLNKW